MPYDFQPSYGATGSVYVYGDNITDIEDVERPVRAQTAETPGRDSAYFGDSFYDPWRLSIKGTVSHIDPATLESSLRALVAAHARGPFRRFRMHTGGDFLFARVTHFKHSNSALPQERWEAAMEAFPYWHSETETAPALTVPVSPAVSADTVISNPGTADALPRLLLTISAAPAGGSVTVTNTTTGKGFTLKPNATGLYTAYSFSDPDTDPKRLLTESVQHATSGDVTRLRSGDFLTLAPGNNSITVAVAGGATLSAASLAFRARYH